MSSKPIFYSSTDVGSPGANPSGNDLTKWLTIFKACLVDGYGDKPAAGWEMVHEHPTGFSITNGKGVLNIVAGSNGHPANQPGFYIAQEATDTSEALIKGINLRSGGWIPDLSLTGSKHTLDTNIRGYTKWVIVANKDFVNFYLTSSKGSLPSYYAEVIILSFGSPKSDFDNFICSGNNNKRYNVGSSLRDILTGEISSGSLVALPNISSGMSTNESLNVFISGDLFLTPVRLRQGNNYSGFFPGLSVDDLLCIPQLHWDKVFNNLDLGSDFFDGVGKPLPFGEHQIAYLFGHGQSYFITDDPRFW